MNTFFLASNSLLFQYLLLNNSYAWDIQAVGYDCNTPL